MSNVKKNGHQLQEQLFRWYVAMTDGSLNAEQRLSQGLNALRHHVEVLIRDGWTLTMSADNSLADKAGVDFIWSNPKRGWFPLDAKAVGQTSCRIIQQVHVGNNSEAGECGQLRAEDKIAFLEQLVKLARTATPISFSDCAPPSVRTARSNEELLEALLQFQRTLERASSRSGEVRLGEWAGALKGAIGYHRAQKRGGPNEATVTAARAAINTAIDAFFASFFRENATFASKVGLMKANLKRSDKLQYVICEDKLKTTVGGSRELVVLGGLAGLIRKRYDERYRELLGKHSCAEWLLQRKRTFETKGVECVIHSILDAFQQQAGGARRAA